jgi:iron complex transport system ATP-binding protein
MKTDLKEILSLVSLKIGYTSGKNKNVLLPPLNAGAKRGEMIAVIGRNGIGKSTLLRTLTGLQRPIGGGIFYYNKHIEDYSRMELAQKVGYISTEIIKVSNMNVYDLVSLGRFPHTNWTGKVEKRDHEIISDALLKTSMSSFVKKMVSELSDGERQKAMIARILAQDTGIMIMDEPTAFLDVASRYDILHLMHILSSDGNKTIIFSTHDLQLAISQSDKIWLILEDGLIEGAPEDLMLSGAFDHLFDSSTVTFNSYDGTFSFRSDTQGLIFVEGESEKRHWTEKALIRAGFNISLERTLPYIVLPVDKNNPWQLVSGIRVLQFNTIYDLMDCLKSLKRNTI